MLEFLTFQLITRIIKRLKVIFTVRIPNEKISDYFALCASSITACGPISELNISTDQTTAQDDETRIFLAVRPDQPCPDVYIERRFIEHAIVYENAKICAYN